MSYSSLIFLMFKMQWGSEYQTFKIWIRSRSKLYSVRKSNGFVRNGCQNGLPFETGPFDNRTTYNHSKSGLVLYLDPLWLKVMEGALRFLKKKFETNFKDCRQISKNLAFKNKFRTLSLIFSTKNTA